MERQHLEKKSNPSLKQLLLAPEARTETLTPPRRRLWQRPALRIQ